MDSQFLPYGKQDINEDDIENVVNVLKSDFLTQGPTHTKFEKEIAKKVNSKYCVSFNSATSALHIACLSLGLGKSDIVWTSPITFVASANCARYCGADVDFVDIDKETGLMSILCLEKKLVEAQKNRKLPKIVIPVHLAGVSCNMKKIHELAKKYNFFIIEDASHALGGKYEEFSVGSCKYSDITIFSLHPVKIITSAEGGLATANSEFIADKMRSLSSHGITKDKKKFIGNSFELWRYEQQDLGYNFRLNDVSAALGLSQLKRLDKFIDKRNKIAKIYLNKLSKLPLKFLIPPDKVKSSYHLFIVQLEDEYICHYEYFFNFLRSKNIGVQLHYLPVHLQPYYQKLGFKNEMFPEAEKYSKSSMSIPIFPYIQKEDIERVVRNIEILFEEISKNK